MVYLHRTRNRVEAAGIAHMQKEISYIKEQLKDILNITNKKNKDVELNEVV